MGWYHSHPHSPALPSLQDIDSQMDYQLRLQGSSNGFQPCLALLCGKAWAARVRMRASGACVRARARVALRGRRPLQAVATLAVLPQPLTTLATRAPSLRSPPSG